MRRTDQKIRRLKNGRPIIRPSSHWWETGVTFNAGAVLVRDAGLIASLLPMTANPSRFTEDGVVAVYYRARAEVDPQSEFSRSYIGLAVFDTCFRLLYRYKEPLLRPDAEPDGIDALGVEDPRITYIDGCYWMVYCGVRRDVKAAYKGGLCLACSRDLIHWKKLGLLKGEINRTNNKDGALFPDKIGGKYLLLHRPYWDGLPQDELAIRLASADAPEGPWVDLGEMMRARPNPAMRTSWIGAGSVPEKVDANRYLMIYHTGNFIDQSEREYDLDAALVDFSGWRGGNPSELVFSRVEHLMRPKTSAERKSPSALKVSNVLFACGSFRLNDDLVIVYGGADTYTLAAKVNWDGLVSRLEREGSGES